MNGIEEPFRKNSDPTNPKKNNINQSELAACEQETTRDKTNFCSNTVFSLHFKILTVLSLTIIKTKNTYFSLVVHTPENMISY